MCTPPLIIENFLQPEECSYFIDTYKNMLEPSTIFSNGELVVTSWRTSSSFVMFNGDDHVIALKQKVSELTGLPVPNIEGLQLLRYCHGEHFDLHHDYFIDNEPYQRIHTVLIYLNDLDGIDNGGATSFPHHRMRVYPKTGRAVWFRNASDDGVTTYPDSLHAGEPVLGENMIKYAINIWVQNKPAFSS